MPLRSLLRALWIATGLALTIWIFWGYQAEGLPYGTLQSNAAVQVTDIGPGIRFQPRANKRPNGLIFLPGGLVDPDAYAPLLKSLAASGHPAYLQRLPLRSAFIESHVNDLFQEIQEYLTAHRDTRWYLAGHSRGAMLSARFARESQSNIAGLILIGTTHPRDFDLSTLPIPITKILGTNDGVATPEATRANANLLPRSTTWVEIPGANHVQFGYYHHQLFDGAAAISRDDQQAALLKAIRRALAN